MKGKQTDNWIYHLFKKILFLNLVYMFISECGFEYIKCPVQEEQVPLIAEPSISSVGNFIVDGSDMMWR